MPLHIIIDGYNLIRQSFSTDQWDASNLEQEREALIRILANYKRLKHHPITVVFDGMQAPSYLPRNDYKQGIDIIFSRNDETADDYIIGMIKRGSQNFLVVSSDREIIDFANKNGATAIASNAFARKLMLKSSNEGYHSNDDSGREWRPNTKKKGPSRRRSKKERQLQTILKKL